MPIKLPPRQFNGIVRLILPEVTTEAERRQLLTPPFSCYNEVFHQIDWSGDAQKFAVRLVEQFRKHGEIEPGQQALAALLDALSPHVGVDRQAEIAEMTAWLKAAEPEPVNMEQLRRVWGQWPELTTVLIIVAAVAVTALLGSLGHSLLSAFESGWVYFSLGAVIVVLVLQLRFPWQEAHQLAVQGSEKRQRRAIQKLKLLLKERIDYEDPRYLAAASVRTLAGTVLSSTQSTFMNDALIAEIIRTVAVELEEESLRHQKTAPQEDELTRKLTRLNNLLDELQPGSGSLLSVVTVDPLAAFKMSKPLISIGLVILSLMMLAFVAQLFVPHWAVRLVFWLLFALFLVFSISGIRVRNYWKNAEEGAPPARNALSRFFSPTQLHPVIDCICYVTVGYHEFSMNFWHINWAPVWEAPLFMTYSIYDLNLMHTFRFFEARPLRSRLNQLHEQLRAQQSAGEELSMADLDTYAGLCRQLWIITGASDYRSMEKRAREGSLLDLDLRNLRMDMSHTLIKDRPVLETAKDMARFETLHRKFLLLRLGEASMPPEEIAEYIQVCDVLYQCTKKPMYRRFCNEAKSFHNQAKG